MKKLLRRLYHEPPRSEIRRPGFDETHYPSTEITSRPKSTATARCRTSAVINGRPLGNRPPADHCAGNMRNGRNSIEKNWPRRLSAARRNLPRGARPGVRATRSRKLG